MCDCVSRSIPVQIRTTADFTREVEGDVSYFRTMPQLINSSTDLDVDGIRSSLDSQVDDHFNARVSGFTIERILEFTLVITKHRSFHGRSYIPTPIYLENKQCIVNVRNEDEKSFLWAILSRFHKAPITRNALDTTDPIKHH